MANQYLTTFWRSHTIVTLFCIKLFIYAHGKCPERQEKSFIVNVGKFSSQIKYQVLTLRFWNAILFRNTILFDFQNLKYYSISVKVDVCLAFRFLAHITKMVYEPGLTILAFIWNLRNLGYYILLTLWSQSNSFLVLFLCLFISILWVHPFALSMFCYCSSLAAVTHLGCTFKWPNIMPRPSQDPLK